MTDAKSCRALWRLSVVPRWVVIPTFRRQTVAEHTYRMLVLAHLVLDKVDQALYDAILTHDKEEAYSGDTPGPYKRMAGIPSEPIDPVVKLLDKLETWVFIQEEYAIGNRSVDTLVHHLTRAVIDAWGEVAADDRLNKWRNAGDLMIFTWKSLDPSIHPLVERMKEND